MFQFESLSLESWQHLSTALLSLYSAARQVHFPNTCINVCHAMVLVYHPLAITMIPVEVKRLLKLFSSDLQAPVFCFSDQIEMFSLLHLNAARCPFSGMLNHILDRKH